MADTVSETASETKKRKLNELLEKLETPEVPEVEYVPASVIPIKQIPVIKLGVVNRDVLMIDDYIVQAVPELGRDHHQPLKHGNCQLEVYSMKSKIYVPDINVCMSALPSRCLVDSLGLIKILNFNVNNKDKSRGKKTVLFLEKLILRAIMKMYHKKVRIITSETWFECKTVVGKRASKIFSSRFELPTDGVGAVEVRDGLQW